MEHHTLSHRWRFQKACRSNLSSCRLTTLSSMIYMNLINCQKYRTYLYWGWLNLSNKLIRVKTLSLASHSFPRLMAQADLVLIAFLIDSFNQLKIFIATQNVAEKLGHSKYFSQKWPHRPLIFSNAFELGTWCFFLVLLHCKLSWVNVYLVDVMKNEIEVIWYWYYSYLEI